MTKYPLFRAMPDEYMVNPHHIWPYEHNFSSPRILAIMHFKFLPDIISKIKIAIESKNYWDDSLEYKCYLETIIDNPEISMMGPTTARFHSPEDFVTFGLISTLPLPSSLSVSSRMDQPFGYTAPILTTHLSI